VKILLANPEPSTHGPLTTEINVRLHVGDWAESGRVVLKMSFVVRDLDKVEHDPKRTLGSCAGQKEEAARHGRKPMLNLSRRALGAFE
jgi:hypothetical protein